MRSPFDCHGLVLIGAATVAVLAPLDANGAGPASSLQDAFRGDRADPCAVELGQQPRAMVVNACFHQSAIRASRAARHEVAFETKNDASPDTSAAYVAAAATAAQAIVEIAHGPDGSSTLADVTKVAVAHGRAPAVTLVGGVLTVTIAPAQGDAGRPSVFEIEQVVRAARLSPT